MAYQSFQGSCPQDVSTNYALPSLLHPNNILLGGSSNKNAFNASYDFEETCNSDIDVARLPSTSKFTKSKDASTFPQRLLQILSEEENTDIICWLPHGNSFIVHDKKQFVEIILPRFFKEAKFTSFTRKLNRWGFTRISRGVETGA